MNRDIIYILSTTWRFVYNKRAKFMSKKECFKKFPDKISWKFLDFSRYKKNFEGFYVSFQKTGH